MRIVQLVLSDDAYEVMSRAAVGSDSLCTWIVGEAIRAAREHPGVQNDYAPRLLSSLQLWRDPNEVHRFSVPGIYVFPPVQYCATCHDSTKESCDRNHSCFHEFARCYRKKVTPSS